MGGNLGRALISAKVAKMMKWRRRSDSLDFPHQPVNGEGEHQVTRAYEPSQALHCIPASRGQGATNPLNVNLHFIKIMSNK